MVATPRKAERGDIDTFVRALFLYADEGTFVRLCAFYHEGGRPAAMRRAIKVNGDLSLIAEAAEIDATAAANLPEPAVFAPPVATFSDRGKATEEALANGLALSVECDARPAEARRKLVAVLGPPTLAVASGGEWLDPQSGEVEQKLHLHWRLTEPTREAQDHAKLKAARRAATVLVGADGTNVPTVHPLRWPGSWHLKGTPRLARIAEHNQSAEVDLTEALDCLVAACEAAGLGQSEQADPAGDSGEPRGTDDLVTLIVTGRDYHGPLVALAARYIVDGMAEGRAVLALRGLLEAVPVEVRDFKDGTLEHGRWQARWNAVPRIVRSAAVKFGAKTKPGGFAANDDWPEPIPLLGDHIAPQPYPIDALPLVMRRAVETYQAFGQQPLALVATSALSCAALACQGLADVSRDGNLVSPSSLSFLIIGASGERKTACENRFSRALVDWQRDRRAEMALAVTVAKSRLDIWTARREAMLGQIKKLSASTKVADEADRVALQKDLERHDAEKPAVPIVPALFSEDVSPEALAVSLACGWPSSSVWSDEGGLVVGSHAMSEDAALRFVTLLNRFWDGRPFERKRTTRESVTVEGRRLTVSLMLQPMVASKLIAAGDGIARGTGNLARFLIAWPTSTMGERLYRSGDLDDPALRAWDARLTTLLRLPLPYEDAQTMVLKPPVLALSGDAFEVWRQLHDEIERQLRGRGEYADLRDFAAKAAEQAARIACVLHVFEHGPSGEIGSATMEAGAALALWHLSEARRVLGIIGQSGEVGDAQLLLEWLEEQPTVRTAGDVLRLGPYALRDKERRDKALAKLAEHGLVREVKVGKATNLMLNPAMRAAA